MIVVVRAAQIVQTKTSCFCGDADMRSEFDTCAVVVIRSGQHGAVASGLAVDSVEVIQAGIGEIVVLL